MAEQGEKTERSDKDSLIVVCQSIVFRNELNGYTVADFKRLDDEGHVFTGTGLLPFLDVGDRFTLDGTWMEHPQYGLQFNIEKVFPYTPQSRQELIKYLSSGAVKWIGIKMAQKIVNHFGDDTLHILKYEPEKLSAIKGISLNRAKEIEQVFKQKSEFQSLSMMLTAVGFSTARIIKIYKTLGADAAHIIRKNPYCLVEWIEGVGFHTADKLAIELGHDINSVFRTGSALLHVLKMSESQGHTYLRISDCQKQLGLLLSDAGKGPVFDNDDEASHQSKTLLDSEFNGAMIDLLKKKKINVYFLDKNQTLSLIEAPPFSPQMRIAFPNLLRAEIRAAQILTHLAQKNSAELMSLSQGVNETLSEYDDVFREIDSEARKINIVLSEEQSRALVMATMAHCAVITGGPGTGKTTIVAVLIRYLKQRGEKIALCAPTGRAAKRLSESCGYDAHTIHRLLEVARDEEHVSFSRNADNPLDTNYVIVDETSMLDILLFQALLDALPQDAKILFIGDKDQLPSVGPGNILSAMMDSRSLPCAYLKHIYRQAQESRIVQSAHRVLSGQKMVFDQSKDSDCMRIIKNLPEDMAKAVQKLYSNILPNIYDIDPIKDAVVLCPTRKGVSGVNALNHLLQEAAGNTSEQGISSAGFTFKRGDRVMQTRNDYELSYYSPDGTDGMGVFNGELGVIQEVDLPELRLTVMLDDGRFVIYEKDKIEDLDPAYAMTVHKSQGCEFPVVILVLPGGAPILYHRNLLYTAITRSKSKLFVVTDQYILSRMIRNCSQSIRLTSLREFIEIQKFASNE